MTCGFLKHISTIQPRPCRCWHSYGDVRTGECLRCGRLAQGYTVDPPSVEESVFELLKA